MDNPKILDLLPLELEFFAIVFDTAYTDLREYYIETNNSFKLEKLNELAEKIDKYIANNL